MTSIDIAGFSLQPPRLFYEADNPGSEEPPRPGPPLPPIPAWRGASLARPHLARTIDGATLTVHLLGEAAETATFDATPFVSPAVMSYIPPPAAAWRALLVDQRLLARPELIWTGTLPQGWDEGLAKPEVEAVTVALKALHQRYRAITVDRWADYHLRTLECAECHAARTAKLPKNVSPWQRSPSSQCTHAPSALRALGALTRACPELTFELLGWLEPAGAVAPKHGGAFAAAGAAGEASGPQPTRFALTGPLMGALLGPWLLGDDRRLAEKTTFRDYGSWMYVREAKRALLPRAQRGAVELCASAWGFTAEAEELVEGRANAPLPSLDWAAAPPIATTAALPGERVRGKAARGKRRR